MRVLVATIRVALAFADFDAVHAVFYILIAIAAAFIVAVMDILSFFNSFRIFNQLAFICILTNLLLLRRLHPPSQKWNEINNFLLVSDVHGCSLEAVIISIQLQEMISLLAYSDFLGVAVFADFNSIHNRLPKQRKLRLDFSDYSREYLACVNSYLNIEIFAIFKIGVFAIILQFHRIISNSYRMMPVQQPLIYLLFSRFETSACHKRFTHRFNFLKAVLLSKLFEDSVPLIKLGE